MDSDRTPDVSSLASACAHAHLYTQEYTTLKRSSAHALECVFLRNCGLSQTVGVLHTFLGFRESGSLTVLDLFIDQAGLEYTEICLQVLGLKAFTTTPDKQLDFAHVFHI